MYVKSVAVKYWLFFFLSNPKTVYYLNFIWFPFELWAMKEKNLHWSNTQGGRELQESSDGNHHSSI